MIFSTQSFGQDDDLIDPVLVRLHAQIINAVDSSAVPYASVVLNRTHSAMIADTDGFFSLEMLNIDSLVISSVGFQKAVVKIPYNYNGNNILVFTLNPVIYMVEEVQVRGERPKINLGLDFGKPSDIPPLLRGDTFNEKPSILDAYFSPIAYLRYHLSKNEKKKRNLRKAIIEEQYWEMHSKNYNKETVMTLTGMTDAQADSFILWFNSLEVLPYTSTEYQVRVAIIEYFEIYQKEGRLSD